MKNSKFKIFGLALSLCAVAVHAQYKLNFTASPTESSNQIARYVGVWRYTNAASSNDWNEFTRVMPGRTNMAINNLVPCPTYVAVRALGTNGALSNPTNTVLYNTNALALIYTNPPAAPMAPGTPTLSN